MISLLKVKELGKNKNSENLMLLLKLYEFIKQHIYNCDCMDLVYQMYRTLLYKQSIEKFYKLKTEVENFYKNEIIYKMKRFWEYKRSNTKKESVDKIKKPRILCGDAKIELKKLQSNSINMIFTSPPYYNARTYSNYKSYQDYLSKMKEILIECNRVLEEGRFIIINVSPVITKRPGREFESIRYPIHFDFHRILLDTGFYFIDEIIWIKPESTVPNRIGGYQQTRKPLSYKPNCITESLMVYRKNADFLLDKNIAKYSYYVKDNEKFETNNCWYINPKSNKNHPAVFPEELCQKVLKYYSFEQDVVLDPFAGSGTLGAVAIDMGRIPVLCEKNEKYIKIIQERLYGHI
jgi:DNA modification methylase